MVAVALSLAIKFFVIDAARIASGSMEYTLLEGDAILINKLVRSASSESPQALNAGSSIFRSFPVSAIERGDVLVLQFPGKRDELKPTRSDEYVKRCVALAGDTIMIKAGIVFVNGSRLNFPGSSSGPRIRPSHRDERLFPPNSGFNLDFYGPLYVPRAGDVVRLTNQNYSTWEMLIRREGHSIRRVGDNGFEIDGRKAESYTVRKNYLFVLGDNFYHSSDSRFWGFVPDDRVIGEAVAIYWSKHHHTDGEDGFLSSIRWERIGTLVR